MPSTAVHRSSLSTLPSSESSTTTFAPFLRSSATAARAAAAGSCALSESRDGPRSALSLMSPKKPTRAWPFCTTAYGANALLPVFFSTRFAHTTGSLRARAFSRRYDRPKRRSRSPTPTASTLSRV